MADAIGRYELQRLIGRGAVASVYLANDPLLGRQVAVKVVPLNSNEDGDYLAKRLEREAFAAGKLQHPSIVTTYEAGRDKDSAYLVMQYVDGRTLEQVLSRGEELSREQVVRILRDISDALDYAHREGIIHRDIKPSNIILDASSGRPMLMDFGVARITASRRTTARGTIVGTAQFMAPEQIEDRPIDGRTDQFSLAVVAYEILTGRLPFNSESTMALMFGILNERPPAPSSLNKTLGPEVDGVLSKALSKMPQERFATCMEFADKLVAACNQSPGWRTQPRAVERVEQKTFNPGAPAPPLSARITSMIKELPALRGTGSVSFTTTRFFAGDKVRFDKIEESLKFYRENLKVEYQRLSHQAEMTYKLWIACVGFGFVILALGVVLMFFSDLARGAVTAASTVLIYFIQRVFQQREDAYRKAADEKSRHLQYGNQWLLVIQSIDAIEDTPERVRRQTALVDVLTSHLHGESSGISAGKSEKPKPSRRAAASGP
ncbi:MAG TPA: serine/threonine-protein kinase [Bryobacteraceae bacterium]|jgi:serine/threonine protein kinase|nr:serine/threonine-protein kinase [Bryobacteraceae bacterium]